MRVPDLDGLVHAPELVDVAHEVDVGADGLAHDAHALDRRAPCVGSLPHCIFIWRKPMLTRRGPALAR